MHRPASFLHTALLLATSFLSTPSSTSPTGTVIKRSYGTAGVDRTFDYVIVGGGTAGLTVASRLAADPSLSVAVIEAGDFYEENGNTSVVPGYDSAFVGTDPSDTNPDVDWGFITEPQKGADNRRMHYASGRTLGGSSARNFMYYHRQTVGSAQKWVDEVGDASFSFPALLPYYEKSVHFNAPKPQYPNTTNDQDLSVFNDALGGPLEVSFGGYDDPFGTWVLPALQKLGQAAIKGFSSGVLIGSGYVAMTIDPTKMTRSSSETAFLQPALKTTTLTLYKNTLAEKLLFNGKTISGVSVSSTTNTTSTPFTLHAKNEIILSAGAFKSPQLLMLSGIGPRHTLQSLSIPVLADLPGVGQNLQDQPYFGTTFRVNVPTASAGMNSPAAMQAAVSAYLTQQAGPLTMGGTSVVGWEKIPRTHLSPTTAHALDTDFPADWPDLEWLPISAYTGYITNFASADPKDGSNYATLTTVLLSPFSRGTVTINSSNPHDQPVIDPAWLTDPRDQDVALSAFRRTRTLWSYMANLTIGPEALPGAAVTSDSDILSFISKSVAPIWHAACTCKMGKEGDSMAVVDSEFRVKGVRGLRVVDASAFPFLPPGHPQATVYAVAEKVAAGILEENGRGRGGGRAVAKGRS
ncbi:hypothetical protein ACLMJK_008692 [Lecanora helva]